MGQTIRDMIDNGFTEIYGGGPGSGPRKGSERLLGDYGYRTGVSPVRGETNYVHPDAKQGNVTLHKEGFRHFGNAGNRVGQGNHEQLPDYLKKVHGR